MRPFSALVGAAALVVLAACASGGSSGGGAAATPSSDAVASSSRPWIARVSALGTSGTQLYGTIRLTPTQTPGEFRVMGDLRGAKLGNQIPWSINTGQCGEPSSAELGDRVAYHLFVAGADGMARLSATIKLPIADGEAYHVNFYASPTDRERVVSCGPLAAG
jgi:hypothetical protein